MNRTFAPASPLVEYGTSSVIAYGQHESGDQYLVQNTPLGTLVAVVDGSGHGKEAARVARLAVTTVEAHFHEGLIPLIRRCHERLKNTRGAVISLVSFCGSENTMTWLGVGNVQGLLLRGTPSSNVRDEEMLLRPGLVGYRLPPLQAVTTPVSPGDLLILTTDGIRGEFGRTLPSDDAPGKIADYISSGFRLGQDDALALVVRYLGWNQ